MLCQGATAFYHGVIKKAHLIKAGYIINKPVVTLISKVQYIPSWRLLSTQKQRL